MHRFHDGAAVAAAHIPDHAIDIEQQDGSGLGAGLQGWGYGGW
jgi:hypothetical protein